MREAKVGFRTDIQGLRAVAVALVVLYHAGVPFLPGGYVGVDVFFVISGFLITGHLAGSFVEHGRIRFSRFYARRALRILPAAFAVIIATTIALVVWAPIPDLPRLLRDARAATLYFPNVRFADLRTDYLADHSASPFEHYWTLGVEEQFYLLWPVVLALVAFAARHRWRVATAVVAVLVFVGFAYGVWLTRTSPHAAFFLLQSRAWELLFGGVIALLARRGTWARMSSAARQVLAWGGIAAVLAAAVTFDAHVAFPGIAVLLPVLGAAAVIAAGTDGRVAALDSALAIRPMQFAGRISYSLYLVHVPLVLVPQVAVGFHRPLPLWLTLLLGVVVAFPVASALHLWVEEPLRSPRPLVRRPLAALAAMAAVTAVIAAALTAAIAWADQREVPTAGPAPALPAGPLDPPPAALALPSNLRPAIEDAATSLPIMYDDGCMLSVDEEAVQDCVYGHGEGAVRVALFGDSHSAQWFPALLEYARRHGETSVSTYTKSSCPAPEVTVLENARPYEACDRWRASVLDALVAERPDLVVISSYGSYELHGISAADREAAWAAGVSATVSRLRAAGIEVLVIADTPRFLAVPATCAAQFPTDLIGCGVDQSTGIDKAHASAEASAALSAGAHTADFTRFLCDGERCPIVFDDLLVYRDTHHLSVEAVEYLSPELARVIDRALGGAGSVDRSR
jgi:peptidoglycan/LPS O-acetylase OafA/YrhL